MTQYVELPNAVSIKDILKNNASFSPQLYQRPLLRATRRKTVRDFLDGEPVRGEEVGSNAYIHRSPKTFVRTKSLQRDSYIPQFTGDTTVPIRPSRFKSMPLLCGDLILSKDSNVGAAALLDQNYPDHMLSGGLLKLPVKENKSYLFAFLKHDLFSSQLDRMVPKGATIRHAKNLYLDCEVPMPDPSDEPHVLPLIHSLVQMVIRRERQIRQNEERIHSLIEVELTRNQRPVRFRYSNPTIEEISKAGRLDASFYGISHGHGQFMIANYKNGSGTIEDWGFELRRGQNLQVSAIGKSIYTDIPKAGYYTLIRPTNLSEYGTVTHYEYLGNPLSLSCITDGDIMFSAEGSIGKCMMFPSSPGRLITNIHGMILRKKIRDEEESAFVCCFLRYLRRIGFFDHLSVGGQGGSLAKNWSEIRIPLFPAEVRNSIAEIYYQPRRKLADAAPSLNRWLKQDPARVRGTATLQLQAQIKELKEKITGTIDSIANKQQPSTDMTFVHRF